MVMVRVLNFVCVALMGMTILALYHISEQTRVERVQLGRVEQRISDERLQMSVLQTQWEQVSQPERIQKIAESALGMGDAATIQLSSLELLPRGGEEAPSGGAQIRTASVQVPTQTPSAQLVRVAVQPGM
jgi:cell division protein FtsL